MKTWVNQIIPQTRKKYRDKISKYPKLKKMAIKLHGQYCNLTGFLHVLPDFYIIGFAKCGTTSLYEYLVQHPTICPPIGKEIAFFDEYYNRGTNWYKACFPLKFNKFITIKIHNKQFLTGEATPRYIDNPHAPFRIKKLTPNAKFIVLLRNPIDRAFSSYMMNVNSALEYEREKLTFEKALALENERIKGEYEKMQQDISYFSWTYYLYAYLNQGIYVDKIQKWKEIFPKNPLLIIQSEKLFRDPQETYNRILKFLGASEYELSEFKKFKIGHYKENKIESNIRLHLSEYFKPHNERLYKLLGERFDWDE
jgi:hypothetical protein